MRDRSGTEYANRPDRMQDMPEEAEYAGSVTAARSEHRARLVERPDEDPDANAIYEMPDEDEHASSPPRSLSNQDVMSEDITTRIKTHKFDRRPKP